MPDLVADALTDPVLPASHLPILEALRDFDRKKKTGGDALDALHDTLLGLARERLPAWPGHDLGLAPERAMAAGALLLYHYDRTVLPILDGVGSQTLHAFRTDISDDVEEDWLRDRLARAFGPLDAVDAALRPELDALARRRTLLSALDDAVPLDATPQSAHRLFQTLYPDSPLRVGEVRVIRTGTSLFFFVPYTGTRLDTRDDPDVTAFLSQLRTVDVGTFPVFTFFEGRRVDPDLLRRLQDDTGYDDAADVLSTMVSLLRLPDVDKYIVHDAWGHQWQAHLLPFEDAFVALDDFETRPATSGDFPTRVTSLLAGPVSELLADITEYKFLARNPGLADRMPSSSHFKNWPTKLDLTLTDLRWFWRRGVGRNLAAYPALIDWTVHDDVVRVTPYARVALALLGLHTTLNDVYRRVAASDRHYGTGFTDFRDLFVLATGAFYTLDPRANVWHLDEFVGLHFERLLDRLLDVLEG